MAQAKIFRFSLYLLFVFVLSCSKDDNGGPSEGNGFYGGADTSASTSKLVGFWAIFSAGFEGEITEVPINNQSCGRDFFVYKENRDYDEYVYWDSECNTQKNQLKWELNNGVVTLSNNLGQSDELVITKLTDNELVFKARVDVDGDGELDILLLYAKRYTPEEVDFTSKSFVRNTDSEYNDLIKFKWQAYDGFNTFEKYEIYRSSGENCSKSNAELVATITNVNEIEYIDVAAPVSPQFCYFMRVYTDQGLLGESYLTAVTTVEIQIDPVNLNQPTVSGDQIELNWSVSESPYFSHYEIIAANHEPGSGYGYQSQTIAVVSDNEITTWVDENPPYIENPFYYIRVHTIFGNSSWYNQDITSYWQVPFKRPDVLSIKKINSYAIDPEEPVVYFWGQESGDGLTPYSITRFNYDTKEVEGISDLNPQVDTSIPIKLIVSPNGKEIVIQQGIELHFYDAATMEYKYAIDPEGVFSIQDFNYFADLDIWVISDGDDIFTLQRDNSNLYLIDAEAHFPNHQGGGRYEFITLKNNQIILGHANEPTSFVYTLDNNGNFIGSMTVNIQFRSQTQYQNERLLYNSSEDILLDTELNRLFSSLTFVNLNSFEKPNFPTGISEDGFLIFGTNNDPEWSIDNESVHKKEAIIFDRNSSSATTVETLGYPHVLFENFRGEVISISSGFKKETLYRDVVNAADIFVEKVQVP